MTAILLHPGTVRAEKKWQGQVPHSAILGDGFAGAKVIMGPISGKCAREFGDLLRQDLLAHDIVVVREAELNKLIAEHHLSISMPLAAGSEELAKLLGMSDLISVEITQCYALPREAMIGTGLPAMHISRTEGHFVATLRVLDVASGKELVTQTLRANPFKENQSPTSNPEYPGVSELVDIAVRQAIGQTRDLFAPWTESAELTFLDDKECNLRQSWELLKANDYFGLLRASRTNAQDCRAGSKTTAAAWYDLGVAAMLVQNYGEALEAFEKSGKLHDIWQAEDLVTRCRRNKAYSEALGRQVITLTRQRESAKDTVQTGILFTNGLVLRLTQGGLAEDDIIRLIRSEPSRFTLDAETLGRLKDAGVGEAVIAAMKARQ